MSTQVELSEMETTMLEKFLAVVLAAFLLVGGLWAYSQPLDRDLDDQAEVAVQPRDQRAITAHEDAQFARERAERSVEVRRDRLDLAREDYRTSLDEGRPDAALRDRFERARRALVGAQTRLRDAQARERRVAPAARAASARVERAERVSFDAQEKKRKRIERETFAMRLAWVLACLAGAFWFLGRQRRRRSRFLPIGMAAVGAATVQALVMAGDYTTDYIDIAELGPLVLSLAGVALTVLAFVGLQRYLAKRLPQRRVRRRECPFCGYPVRENAHCEGCGREVVAACSSCSAPRRVGTEFCGSCGSA